MSSARSSGPKPALRVASVTKAFGGTQALDGVSFELFPGTIHALLGGNGSGKSTIIKILAGVVSADSGEFALGQTVYAADQLSPSLAHRAGLRFVHQQNSTFPQLTVAENLAIGRGFETGSGGVIRWREVQDRAREVLARFELGCSPNTPLGQLSPAARTIVAIARALQDQEREHSGILVLDEPTAALPRSEVDLLFSALRRYANAGQSILYVTHRLEEAIDVADRATVLRDGRLAATVDRFDRDTLTHLIMGRQIDQLTERQPETQARAIALRAEGLAGGPLRRVTFSLCEGEVLGIAGVLGSGRSTLLRMLFGKHPLASGSITLGDQLLNLRHPRDAIDAGIVYVPEDRTGEAAFGSLDLTENISVASVRRYWRRGHLDFESERRDTHKLMDSFSVQASSENAVFTSLSGGNQQKAILARWLRREPRVLLLDEPTQGVDVGARIEIWKLVNGAVDAGAAAIVVSSDFEELSSVCNRAIVLEGGRTVGTLSGVELTENHLNHLAYGGETVASR